MSAVSGVELAARMAAPLMAFAAGRAGANLTVGPGRLVLAIAVIAGCCALGARAVVARADRHWRATALDATTALALAIAFCVFALRDAVPLFDYPAARSVALAFALLAPALVGRQTQPRRRPTHS